jgi:hypothetical protein
MTLSRTLCILLLAGIVWLCGPGLTSQTSISGTSSIVPTAQAIIGMPLTPVSVAGVARRTVRRCAVGVYYC